MDEQRALGLALGHVRNALIVFAAVDDPSGESSFLALECLDLEGLIGGLGVDPESVEPDLDAAGSLTAASDLLWVARDRVPLVVWAALQGLRSRAS